MVWNPMQKNKEKWHSAKYRYKYNKNESSKIALKQASKLYKKVVRQSYIKFKRFDIKKLRNFKNANLKTYWKKFEWK